MIISTLLLCFQTRKFRIDAYWKLDRILITWQIMLQQSPWYMFTYLFIINKNFLHPLQSLDAPSLQDISLNLNSNHLLAVIGPVGAGKVSYLPVISVFDSSWELLTDWDKTNIWACSCLTFLHACFPPVLAAELHPWRAARRKGGPQGRRSADLRLPAALGVPWDHPQ